MNDNEINPATGLPMVGDVDVCGNPYGCDFSDSTSYKNYAQRESKPCSDDEFAHRLLVIVCMFSFFFLLFVIGCSLK